MLRRDPVVLAWGVGLGLAALVYVVGPGQFLFRLMDFLHMAAWRIGETIAQLSLLALDVVRALAIGLYATFAVLAIALARRGGRSRAALLVVTLVFVILVDSGAELTDSNARWTAALVLSAAGSLVMTARLRPNRARGTDVNRRRVGGPPPGTVIQCRFSSATIMSTPCACHRCTALWSAPTAHPRRRQL